MVRSSSFGKEKKIDANLRDNLLFRIYLDHKPGQYQFTKDPAPPLRLINNLKALAVEPDYMRESNPDGPA
jgi:hypothetical protein